METLINNLQKEIAGLQERKEILSHIISLLDLTTCLLYTSRCV